jgi:hypothetical protein
MTMQPWMKLAFRLSLRTLRLFSACIPRVLWMSRTLSRTSARSCQRLYQFPVSPLVHLRVGLADPSSADDFSDLPLESLYGFMVESSESYFGWDLADAEWDHMKSLNTHAPNTPREDWLLPINPSVDPSALSTSASAYQRVPPSPRHDTLPSPQSIGDAQPTDSPWVSQAVEGHHVMLTVASSPMSTSPEARTADWIFLQSITSLVLLCTRRISIA